MRMFNQFSFAIAQKSSFLSLGNPFHVLIDIIFMNIQNFEIEV